MNILVKHYDSPCGRLMLASFSGRLCLCDWLQAKHRTTIDKRLQTALKAQYAGGTSEVLEEAERQLDEYFARRRTSFDLPLTLTGTDFQKRVWERLRRLPYGATASYASLAQALGQPKAVRAVANANGANPIAIVIPCHRIIGADGTLTGYAGGLDAKRYLLQMESGLTPLHTAL